MTISKEARAALDRARQTENHHIVTCTPRLISMRFATCANIVHKALDKNMPENFLCEKTMKAGKCAAIKMMAQEYKCEEILHFTPADKVKAVRVDDTRIDSHGVKQPRHPENPQYMRGWECMERAEMAGRKSSTPPPVYSRPATKPVSKEESMAALARDSEIGSKLAKGITEEVSK